MDLLQQQNITNIHFQSVHVEGLFICLACVVIIYQSSSNCKEDIHKFIRLICEINNVEIRAVFIVSKEFTRKCFEPGNK